MKKILFILSTLLLFSSCEKLFFDEAIETNDPMTNFEYLWNECDRKYSYFELKKINWDSIKTVYTGKVYPGMSDDSLFNVLGAMLSALKDDHTNLISDFNISRFGVKYLGQDNFDWRIIVDHYLGSDYYISGPLKHNFLPDENIGYVRFSEFSGIKNENLDFVLNRYKFTDGIILDIRENGGGYISDVFKILSRFINTKTLIYYVKIKTGEGHNDFSEPEPTYIYPYSGIKYLKKVIILTDRGTYSAGSLTSLGSKALANVSLVGDYTGGGLGLPNGEQLPNGWSFRFSVTQTLTLDKNPEYEKGVPPDYHVLFDWNNLNKDEILEKAIEIIKN